MRTRLATVAMLCALALGLSACRERATGPVTASAIGGPPQLVNPNLEPLDPASAFLLEAAAQGLVRFDAAGEIEPALAQSWIVSDDGLRYTFRIRRTEWAGGGRVTAEQVVARLRAAVSRASRNPLKPALSGISEIVAMTDEVLEISLAGPRPNFLQLLAQPEMAIVREGRGTGPYRAEEAGPRLVRLVLPAEVEEELEEAEEASAILLRGEAAALAVARFAEGQADLVTGGTAGDLPFAVAAQPGDALVHDRAAGLFGLRFASAEGPLSDPEIRRALSMAIDRQALVAAIGVAGLEPRTSLVGAGAHELPQPAQPDWAGAPLPMRRELAARAVDALWGEGPARLRVAVPDGPGYRRVFAYLRRDWRLIGVEAERVPAGAAADLELVDSVAPAALASWYLRHFTCEAGPVCDPLADQALESARIAPTAAERRSQLAVADSILTGIAPFVPLAAPVRWSLVGPRLTGFRPNAFARHPASELIAAEQ